MAVHTAQQKRLAAERARDLMTVEGISQNEACRRVASELDPRPSARSVARWAQQNGIDLTYDSTVATRGGTGVTAQNAREAKFRFTLDRRRELADEQGLMVSMLTRVFLSNLAAEQDKRQFTMDPAEFVKTVKELTITAKNVAEMRHMVEEREEALGIIDGDSQRPDTSDLETGMALLAQAEA